MDENDIVYRLRKRAEIRRQIPNRKSVQEGQPDRMADLLDEAAEEIARARGDTTRAIHPFALELAGSRLRKWAGDRSPYAGKFALKADVVTLLDAYGLVDIIPGPGGATHANVIKAQK